MGNLPTKVQAFTVEQITLFSQLLISGATLPEAAAASGLDISSPQALSDLVTEKQAQLAVDGFTTGYLNTLGKLLALQTMLKTMTDKEAKPGTKLAAAKWMLEASGEGVGATRAQRVGKSKDIYEMTEAELMQVVDKARTIVEGTAVDVTPRAAEKEDYGDLFTA